MKLKSEAKYTNSWRKYGWFFPTVPDVHQGSFSKSDNITSYLRGKYRYIVICMLVSGIVQRKFYYLQMKNKEQVHGCSKITQDTGHVQTRKIPNNVLK